MAGVLVSDPDDSRLGPFRNLHDESYRRSVESGGPLGPSTAIAEGWLAVQRAAKSRHRIVSVLVDESKSQRAADIDGLGASTILNCPQEVLSTVVGYDLHRGVLAQLELARPPQPETLLARSQRLLVAVGVGDSTNMGMIIRNAAALGADGLMLESTCCSHLSRRSIRVSVGYALTLPIARWGSSPLLAALTSSAHTVIGLAPQGTETVAELGQKQTGPLAIAIGAEGAGLSNEFLVSTDHQARIPMAPGIDSLNVATAAAVAMSQLFAVPS